MTLGASPSGTFQAAASFRDLDPNKHQQSKSVIMADSRHKPAISPRHKNSEFEQYIVRHRSPAINAVPLPFTINEDGRQKKTEVEAHIIQRKKVNRDRFEKKM